jgi:hypothetical protein
VDGSGITISTKMGGIAYSTLNIEPAANIRIVTSGKSAMVINKK